MIQKHMNVTQATEYLNSLNISINCKQLQKLCRENKIGYTRPNGNYLLLESDIQLWLKKNGNKSYDGCLGNDPNCIKVLYDIKKMIQKMKK